MEVRLYTKKQCPLCDEAKQILIDLQADYPALEIKEIDIETSDHLIEQFSLMIPVVEIKGEIVQYGKVDYITISEHLNNVPPQAASNRR